MRRWRLSTLLIAFNLAVILGAIALVGMAGMAMLRRLATEQALAQVRLGSVAAAGAIERSGARLLTAARLLAERPTLTRLIESGTRDGLQDYLARFCATSELSRCAVVVDGRVVVQAGDPPMTELGLLPAGESLRYVTAGPAGLAMVARAGVRASARAEVVVARGIDDAFANEIGRRVGIAVRVLSPSRVHPGNAAETFAQQALLQERVTAGIDDGGGGWIAAAPLRDPAGSVVGVAEVLLPASEVDEPLRVLAGSLVGWAAVVAALAVVASLLAARRLAGPLERLSEAVERIGGGDLSSPVPRFGAAEVGTLSTAIDVMRARVLELMTELRRRRAEADAVLEGIVEGVFAVDRERRIRYINPQAVTLLGVDEQQVLGRFCGDVLDPRGPDGERPCDTACPILHARFRGNARAHEELRLASGERRSVVITSAPSGLEGEEGAPEDAHQFQVLRDETEIEAARRLRDSILANISHEFRSPLSAQLASLELLRDRLHELPRDQIQELVLSLERGALRLTRLIDNLLESTRIEAGRLDLRRKRVELDEVIEEAVELVRPLIEQREQELLIELPFPLPAVTGDAPRLTQVFVNLLANANKFGPPRTPIRIGGAVRDAEIELWVEDRGPGLPAGPDESIFERFMRATAGEPAQSGMGLGLWVVKSIATRHGGRVVVGDAHPGTRIGVVLPRGAADEDPGR